MIIKAFSISQLYDILDNNNHYPFAAVICTCYPLREDKLDRINYLHLEFEDITNRGYGRRFSSEDAFQISSFIMNFESQIDTLNFCCDSGVSRSAALAAAFMKYYQMDEMKIWNNPHYSPNPLVYRIMCQALGLWTPKTIVYYKTIINKRALAMQLIMLAKTGGIIDEQRFCYVRYPWERRSI